MTCRSWNTLITEGKKCVFNILYQKACLGPEKRCATWREVFHQGRGWTGFRYNAHLFYNFKETEQIYHWIMNREKCKSLGEEEPPFLEGVRPLEPYHFQHVLKNNFEYLESAFFAYFLDVPTRHPDIMKICFEEERYEFVSLLMEKTPRSEFTSCIRMVLEIHPTWWDNEVTMKFFQRFGGENNRFLLHPILDRNWDVVQQAGEHGFFPPDGIHISSEFYEVPDSFLEWAVKNGILFKYTSLPFEQAQTCLKALREVKPPRVLAKALMTDLGHDIQSRLNHTKQAKIYDWVWEEGMTIQIFYFET